MAFGSTLQREQEFSEDRWKERITRESPSSPSATWAAVDEADRFLGTAVAARVDGVFHIFAMWVAPENRGRGVGGRLLDTAIDWVRESSPGSPIRLEVNSHNIPAVRLYESRAFRFTGKSSPLYYTPTEEIREMIRRE